MSLANINTNPRTLDENNRNWQRFGTIAGSLLLAGHLIPADLASGGTDTQVLTISGGQVVWAEGPGSSADFFNY